MTVVRREDVQSNVASWDEGPYRMHAVGERVEDPNEVLPALRRGLDHVKAGRSVILDVILRSAQ
jgi:hypothetical protein